MEIGVRVLDFESPNSPLTEEVKRDNIEEIGQCLILLRGRIEVSFTRFT